MSVPKNETIVFVQFGIPIVVSNYKYENNGSNKNELPNGAKIERQWDNSLKSTASEDKGRYPGEGIDTLIADGTGWGLSGPTGNEEF